MQSYKLFSDLQAFRRKTSLTNLLQLALKAFLYTAQRFSYYNKGESRIVDGIKMSN